MTRKEDEKLAYLKDKAREYQTAVDDFKKKVSPVSAMMFKPIEVLVSAIMRTESIIEATCMLAAMNLYAVQMKDTAAAADLASKLNLK